MTRSRPWLASSVPVSPGQDSRLTLIATTVRRRPWITGQLLACAVTFAALVMAWCGTPRLLSTDS